MKLLDRLLSAKTETELFVLISSLSSAPRGSNIRAELKSVVEQESSTLSLTLAFPARTHVEDHILLHWQTQHIFRLDGQGRLTWQLPDRRLIAGLQDIKLLLAQMKDEFPASPFELSTRS